MKTNKKQIKDLELLEVDYLVAKAEGLDTKMQGNQCFVGIENLFFPYSPTTNPSQAWPIIEREGICLNIYIVKWEAHIIGIDSSCCEGKTSLEAAMRCYVVSKFGNEVEL